MRVPNRLQTPPKVPWLSPYNIGKRQVGSIYTDTSGLTELARGLREAGGLIFVECQAELVLIAEEVRDTAIGNAMQFSTRIPPTIHVRRTRGLNVTVEAGGPSAPHARPIENHGRGFVSHPIFGYDPMTNKNSHPAYLQPALDAHRAELDAGIQAALTRAVMRSVEVGGFYGDPRNQARALFNALGR